MGHGRLGEPRAVLFGRTGIWRIIGNLICVAVDGGLTLCRHVWQDPATGKIAMIDLAGAADAGRRDDPVLVMTGQPLDDVRGTAAR